MSESPSVLLVEDEPFLREALRLLLEDAGYEVREAGTAGAALAAIKSRHPALVLLDLGLPDRNGLDLARELADGKDTHAIPVVALTGRAGAEERRRCLDAGCRDYFVKPVEPADLLARIPEILK